MQVEYEGQIHQFPDDFTDADISAALASLAPAAPSQAPAAPPTTAPSLTERFQPAIDRPLQPAPAPQDSSATRGLKLGAQATGRGLIDLLAAPADIANIGANAAIGLTDYVSQKVGGPEIGFRFPMASDEMAKTATNAAEVAGYTPAEPKSFGEKAVYNAQRYGTQGAASAVALARAALARAAEMTQSGALPKAFDSLLRPYMTSPAKTTIGDAVAGAGAGSALAASQELPESVRAAGGGTAGPAIDLIAMLGGGVGAGTLANVATGSPTAIRRAMTSSRPVDDIPLDPETTAATTNKTADAVAKYLQGEAVNPAQAAANIDANAASYTADGLPVPTTGALADDPGLLAVERGQRGKLSVGPMLKDAPPDTKAEYSFGARDTALRDAAVENVEALRPAGARPEAFPERAAEIADAQRNVAQRDVDRAAGRGRAVETARRGPAEDLNANAMQGDAASTNIDQMYRTTRTAERQQSSALYNDPALTRAEVPEAPLTRFADRLHDAEDARAPLDPVVRKYVDRFRTIVDEEGNAPERPPLTMETVNANRAEIEADIQDNLKNGNVTRQLRDLKAVVSRYGEMLANQGNTAAREASENYATRIRPNFREGAGGRMDAKLKRDSLGQNTRPSDTAKTFLTRPEDTADLMRIAALRGNEAETAANARAWLFDRLAQTGVARNGAIDPEKLTRWRNANAGVLDNVPGLRAEVDGMVTQARRGEDTAARYAQELRAAEGRLADTERTLASGPIGQAAGASPEKAVASIFAARNPVEAARELKRTVGRNPDADAGMRAAVADHFAARVSNVTPGRVTDGDTSIGFAKLVREFNKNRQVLAVIYSPEEMNVLQRAHKALEPLAKQGSAQATTGSITAESSQTFDRMLEIGFKTAYGGLAGGNKFRNYKLAAKHLFTDTGEADAQRLLSRAMFDPQLAKILLTREVADPGTPAWNAQLQKYIRRLQVGKELTKPEEEE